MGLGTPGPKLPALSVPVFSTSLTLHCGCSGTRLTEHPLYAGAQGQGGPEDSS